MYHMLGTVLHGEGVMKDIIIPLCIALGVFIGVMLVVMGFATIMQALFGVPSCV